MAPNLYLDLRLESPQKRFLKVTVRTRESSLWLNFLSPHQQAHEQRDGKGVTSNFKPDGTDTALTAPQLTAG